MERPEPLVPVGVDALPFRIGLDLVADPDTRLHRLPGVDEHPRRNASEQRRTVGCALLDGRPLERQSEHGRDDPKPKLAARPSTGDAASRDLAPQLAYYLEAVAQPVRHSFHDGTNQCSPVVTQRETDEGAACVRIGVRSALAGEIGKEGQSLHARLPLPSLPG